MVAESFIEEGNPITTVLRMIGISRSSYYYQPTGDLSKRGRKKSLYTRTERGEWLTNELVVIHIKGLLVKEFVDYGYLKVTHWLRQSIHCIINPKKVYDLMKSNNLLNIRRKRYMSPRRWVNDFVPRPSIPFEYIEVDIKYIYIHGLRKNALLLTAIDVESRWILGQKFSLRLNQNDVIELFDDIFNAHTFPSRIYVRNDNGSHFEAQLVQKYFAERQIVQEFTQPATPQQNAHIEAYHSIVESVICQKYEFESFPEAGLTLQKFKAFYNFERIHSGIDYLTPYKYLFQKGIDLKVNQSPFETFCLSTPNVDQNTEPTV